MVAIIFISTAEQNFFISLHKSASNFRFSREDDDHRRRRSPRQRQGEEDPKAAHYLQQLTVAGVEQALPADAILGATRAGRIGCFVGTDADSGTFGILLGISLKIYFPFLSNLLPVFRICAQTWFHPKGRNGYKYSNPTHCLSKQTVFLQIIGCQKKLIKWLFVLKTSQK